MVEFVEWVGCCFLGWVVVVVVGEGEFVFQVWNFVGQLEQFGVCVEGVEVLVGVVVLEFWVVVVDEGVVVCVVYCQVFGEVLCQWVGYCD